MNVFYIAGPFRGPTPWDVVQNIRIAEQAALKVWQSGEGAALCPHLNSANFTGAADDQDFLEGGLELLRRCDGVLLCGEWYKSSGTRAEIREALRLKLPVWGSFEDFIVDRPLSEQWIFSVIGVTE